MSNVRRVYVEKKPDFAVKAKELKHEIKHYLGITTVEAVRVLIRYDVENISEETYKKALYTVFSEPPVDDIYEETFDYGDAKVFTVEFLPGQFDQRADSAEQCVKLLNENEEPIIRSAITYVIEGAITDEQFAAIKKHCINPVDSRAIGMEKPKTLVQEFDDPADVIIFDGFKDMAEDKLKELYLSLNLAMTFKDFLHIQNYFKNEEKRDPSMTEIRVLDTYWSDHCRHTTFSTELKNVKFDDGFYRTPIENTYKDYLNTFSNIYKDRNDKFVCLMDLALLAMKRLKAEGKLDDQEESDEINACSIVVPVEVDGKTEEWLVNFKNETHNHPTEIEPFGGAATCLGGAIRDPLSGRTYVYQAMRVTGAADPTVPVSQTIEGKLPQKKLVREAAHGYSSYGNQIGLATGYVKEVYHPNYVAKRMEIGAVMGAAPRRAVQRLNSDPGDKIILLGGRTGRDGIGGATGSSKAHNTKSTSVCGAEVQKGNAPTERKLQRLFRRPEVSRLIKKCNDFGAGGVSVAIGELTDGLVVNLDKVPKKYEGLDGTELAISESQERMAVVIEAKDLDDFIKHADKENLEATVVAEVSDNPRLVMYWRGEKIVDLARAFLDTNGVAQHTNITVKAAEGENAFDKVPECVNKAASLEQAWLGNLNRLNVCSQKGLSERFDSTIGRGTVLMPFGGKTQFTPSEGMVCRLPVLNGTTTAASVMACGYHPDVACWSPFHGAMYAVVESVVRAVCLGADPDKLRLTLQEYFPKLNNTEVWGQPFSALLGAFTALDALDLPAIGGKDSMSGTFMDKTVPPTLVSFAVDVIDGEKAVSAEFKAAGHKVVFLSCPRDNAEVLDFAVLRKNMRAVHKAVLAGKVLAAAAVKEGGIAAAVTTMCLGNQLGFEFIKPFQDTERLFTLQPGGMVLELADGTSIEELFDGLDCMLLGHLTAEQFISINDTAIRLDAAQEAYLEPLQEIFPYKIEEKAQGELNQPLYRADLPLTAPVTLAKPRVFIPVFPGTNCEYDSARAFERSGAKVVTRVLRNMSAEDIRQSVDEYRREIAKAQIVMFPGGFSAGDEPDGSAKFFATAFQNAGRN